MGRRSVLRSQAKKQQQRRLGRLLAWLAKGWLQALPPCWPLVQAPE
jgi:hypothetical protein